MSTLHMITMRYGKEDKALPVEAYSQELRAYARALHFAQRMVADESGYTKNVRLTVTAIDADDRFAGRRYVVETTLDEKTAWEHLATYEVSPLRDA